MRVILKELIRCDQSVCLCSVEYVVMQFKGFKELCEHLIFCSFPAFNIWMHTSVVFVSQVSNCENAVAIEVKRLEGSQHDLLSKQTERALHNSHEFVEVNHTVAVDVERPEKTVNVFRVNINAEIVDCFCKFVLVKST